MGNPQFSETPINHQSICHKCFRETPLVRDSVLKRARIGRNNHNCLNSGPLIKRSILRILRQPPKEEGSKSRTIRVLGKDQSQAQHKDFA